MITVDQAATDPKLLGAALGDTKTWRTWMAVLRAAFGLQLNRSDRRTFEAVAKRRSPAQRVKELWAVVGRRSGKSRIAALLAVFFACFVPHKVAAGEIPTVLVLAASKDQAKMVFSYALGFLSSSPVLAGEITDTTADEIRLRNGVVIAIHAASFRTVRGRTILAAICDEVSFWRDDTSANPDMEVYRAVLPALATTGGMLIGISTGYRKLGLLYQKHRDHFGIDDPNVLVVAGATEQFNPSLDKKVIEASRQADPEAAEAEWNGSFRRDIAAFLDDATIDAALDHGRPLELPPRAGVEYFAFADPSGGRHDAFTLCIGHRENEAIIADVVRGAAAPFNPSSVTSEFAALLKQYGIREVTADNYASEWAASAWEDAGIKHKRSELNKSELYLEGLPEFMRGTVRISDHPRLVRELRLLERRTSRIGRDLVDHGRNGSDDYANALFGMIRLAVAPQFTVTSGFINGYGGCGSISYNDNGPRQRLWSRAGGGVSAVDGSRVEASKPAAVTRLHRS